MAALKNDEIRQAVRERYGRVPESDGASGGCSPSCCGSPAVSADSLSREMGYSAADVLAVPAGANLGLGCGNPRSIAALKPGETVLDLGSGSGGLPRAQARRARGDLRRGRVR